MDERVTIALEDGVADVRLARADKMNALDPAMFASLAAAIDRLAGAPGLRAVVLSGEGRGFCAGLDMAAMAAGGSGLALGERTADGANLVQQVAWGWHTLPMPVIAAVHGVAFGGGFQIMSGADIRMTPQSGLGTVPPWAMATAVSRTGAVGVMPVARDGMRLTPTSEGGELIGLDADAITQVVSLRSDQSGDGLGTIAAELAEARPIVAGAPVEGAPSRLLVRATLALDEVGRVMRDPATDELVVEAAERAAHRLVLEVERLRTERVVGQAALARALNERGVPTPQGRRARTHTTVARVVPRVPV